MLKLAFPVVLAVSAGVSLVVQQALNANLRGALGSVAWSGFAGYLVGFLGMAALMLVVLRDPVPSAGALARVPWWAWSGGLFGTVFITFGIVLVPRLGAATFFASLVTGQMLASLAFDHFGLFGLVVQPASFVRLAGAALLILGVVLVRM